MQTPTKKIISVLIICFGLILSIWFFVKGPKITTLGQKKTDCDTADCLSPNDNTPKFFDENDWKKILLGDDTGTTTILTSKSDTVYPGEGTETDQMAKDILGQYLMMKQGGKTVTPEQINQIVQTTLASPQYTKVSSVQYTSSDIHITADTSPRAADRYMNDGKDILYTFSSGQNLGVMTIMETASKSQKESDLAKLDPIIKSYKGIIASALKINVPKDAVALHLALLNSLSNTLSDIEGMRQTLTDPVRGFVGLSQYKVHVLDVQTALNNLSAYFATKGVLNQ